MGRHLAVAIGGLLLPIDGVMPLLDAVAFEDARFDFGVLAVYSTQIIFHLVIRDRFTREKLANAVNKNVVHDVVG